MRTAKTLDQTGQMPRLIRVFAGRTLILLFCHVAAQIMIDKDYQIGSCKTETDECFYEIN